MLDAETYRISERLAKAQSPTWRISAAHNVDHFERVGFPVRISSYRDLGQLLDTMQEFRFDKYMRELGGLTDEEYALVIEACKEVVLFQATYLPNRRPILPISTLLSNFTLYKKMIGIDRNFDSVLEIGPGCGYLSFFLRRHSALRNYTQIEAAESFYILQSLINVHCFGAQFEERAFLQEETSVLNYFAAPSPFTEIAPHIHFDRRKLCSHYPWWRIGELPGQERKFQIVMSNANLLEFNPTALEDYLSLLLEVLEPEGVFLMQCAGYPAHGSIQDLLTKLWEKGFGMLMFALENKPHAQPQVGGPSHLLTELKRTSGNTLVLTVNNGLFIKAGHPLYNSYRERPDGQLHFIGNERLVNDVFFSRPPNRRMYSVQQFVEDTEKALRT